MGKVLSVDQNNPSSDVLMQAEQILRAEGVLVVPTDSVYGIGCAAIAGNPAHERVFQIKQRPANMTLPWLIADASELHTYGHMVPSWAHMLAQAFWPGALTLVVNASDKVPLEYLSQPSRTIALRVPNSLLVRELARRVGPLAVTSANTHGIKAATSGSSVEPDIVLAADLTLDGGCAPLAVASTIVDCTTNTPHVLREGAISTAEITRRAL